MAREPHDEGDEATDSERKSQRWHPPRGRGHHSEEEGKNPTPESQPTQDGRRVRVPERWIRFLESPFVLYYFVIPRAGGALGCRQWAQTGRKIVPAGIEIVRVEVVGRSRHGTDSRRIAVPGLCDLTEGHYVLYGFMKATLGSALKVFYQPWIRGAHNIPDDGPAILASNHLAVIDSFFLPLMIRREVVFMGKSDYFTGKGLKGKAVAAFMRGVGTIPVDRSGGKASEAALRTGLKRLQQGELFGIYPEGTRSPDGRLYRGKTGVARLALESGAPVIPVAMIGTNIAQPIGTKIPKLHRIGIVVGEPLDFSRYQGMASDRFVLRSITDEIMYELMRLSGQEYVDIYAASMKNRLAAAKKAKEEPLVPVSVDRIGAPGGRAVPAVEVPEPTDEEIRAGQERIEAARAEAESAAAAAAQDEGAVAPEETEPRP